MAINKERLLKLADFLETVPHEKFNLGSWVQSMPTKPEAKREGSCGFAGCAIGWAAHAKLFPEFRLGKQYSYDGDPNRPPQYGDYTGFDAVEALFDIPYESACYLFVDEEYPQGEKTAPGEVSKRIRQFVEDAA